MMAEPVSPETARKVAVKFLNKKGTTLRNEAMRARSRAMGHANKGAQTEASPYYVFNVSQGFVVVSGEHHAEPAAFVGKPAPKNVDVPDDRFSDRIYDKPTAPAQKPQDPIGTRKGWFNRH